MCQHVIYTQHFTHSTIQLKLQLNKQPEATTAAEQVKNVGDGFHRHQTDV